MIEKLRRLDRPLWFLFAGTTVTRLGTFVFPLLTVYLSQVRDFPLDEVGLIMSVGSLGLLAGNFAGGWLADTWSRKSTLVIALIANAIGFFGLAFEYEAGFLYALLLFVGYFGSGMYTPAANTIIADMTSTDDRAFAYTVNYVCINLGMALGPLIGGVLADVAYRWVFLGDVGTTLICAGLILYGVVESRHERAKNRGGEPTEPRPSLWGTLGRHRLVTAFCFANFFIIAPLMGLEFSVPLLVKETYEVEALYIGIVYTINAACILALSFSIERVVRDRGDLAMMANAGLLWTAGLVILNVGHSLPALLICTAVWTVGEIIASVVVPTFISRRVASEYKGRFLALNDAMRSLASVLCPIVLGAIWEGHGERPVLLILLALPLLGTLSYVGMLVVGNRRRDSLAVG